ncbi:MAG TPA: hypothetical protein VMT47_17410 [Polyangia bacterium]|nr:hypothetical protein [Polyangia bacterium]
MGSIIDRCPHLAAFIGAGVLQGLMTEQAKLRHPLLPIASLWPDEQRDQYLTSLDRSAEIMETVFRRSPDRVRAQIAGNFTQRETYEAARAELTCGARLEQLGHSPIMEGEAGTQPDFRCVVCGQIYYVEVYTPFAAPVETIVDDVREQLRDVQSDCFVFLKTSGLARNSKTVKHIAAALRRGIAETLEAGVSGSIFAIPAGGGTADWQAKLGAHQFETGNGEPRLFARGTVDGTPGLRIVGGADLKVADPLGAARKALRKFGQLRKGSPNVLVVDLTSILPNQFDVEAYERAGQEVCTRRPELSAVLLTWRGLQLRPSPSNDMDIVSGYRLVRSKREDAARLPAGVAEGLVRPGLIYPGRHSRLSDSNPDP